MRIGATVLIVALGLAAPAAAQGPDRQPPDARQGSIDADRLPVSLERIQRKLAVLPPSNRSSVLKLEEYVEVYGKAPRLDLFTNFDPRFGPVPWGAPTHQDFLDEMTPKAFRTPPFDLSALMDWLGKRLNKKKPQ